MKVYDILKQHPEWIADPKAHRAEISDYAHTYIWELFKIDEQLRSTILWHDLNKIMQIREALIMFCGLDGEADQITEAQTRADQNKAAILERLIKAICWQLADYDYHLKKADIAQFCKDNEGALEFMAINDWPTNEMPKKRAKEQWLKGIPEEKAKSIYKKLKEAQIIDCSEDDFLWYFSTTKAKERAANTTTPPDKLNWKPTAINNFAYFGVKVFQTMTNTPDYKNVKVNWQALLNIFSVTFTAEQLKSAKNGILNGRDSLPQYATEIENATTPDEARIN